MHTESSWHTSKSGPPPNTSLGRICARLPSRRDAKRACRRAYIFLSTWCVSCLSLGGFAHLALIACVVFQSVCLDLFLIEYLSQAVLVVLCGEIPLLMHLMWYWRQDTAAKAAPFQWLVYSWIHGAKVVVLFCKVMPKLPTPTNQIITGVGTFSMTRDEFYSPTTLANLLLLTPVFYTLLMFRTGAAIFGSSSHKISVDLIMHYDMLWHVVIDMVDMVDMFHYARLAERVGPDVLVQYKDDLVTMQSAVPFMLFIAYLLHGQSLPGVVVDEFHLLDPRDQLSADANYRRAQPSSSSLDPLSRGTFGERGTFRKGLQSVFNKGASRPSGASIPEEERQRSGSDFTSDGEGSSVVSDSSPDRTSQPPPAPAAESRHPSFSTDRPGSLRSVGPPMELSLEETAPRQLQQDDAPFTAESTEVKRFTLQSNASGSEAQPRNASTLSLSEQGAFRPNPSTFSYQLGGQPTGVSSWKGGDGRRPQSARLARAERQRGGRYRHRRLQEIKSIINLIQRHTVVIARKRSAIVSIFFIDMPFLFMRIWLFILSNRAGQPHFPGLGAKNGVCFLLNTVQFALVQTAGSEGYWWITRQLGKYRYNCRRKQKSSGSVGIGLVGSDSDGSTRMRADSDGSTRGMGSGMGAYGTAVTTTSTRMRSAGRMPGSPGLEGEHETPHSGSSPSPHGSSDRGSPHIRNLQREHERRGIAEAESEIRRETRRSTSICTHFWTLLLAFATGILLTQASQSSGIDLVLRWVVTAGDSAES